MNWKQGYWEKYWHSALSIIMPGVLWLFVYFMTTSGYFMYLVNERNSGIKSLMETMGLDTVTYWVSQVLGYCMEGAAVMILGGIGVSVMVSQQVGDHGIYVFLRGLYV
eukprot:UN27554